VSETQAEYDPRRTFWTGTDVAELRARLGLSQAAFAQLLGVRQQTVSEWETGRYAPRGASRTVLMMVAEERAPYTAVPAQGESPGELPAPAREARETPRKAKHGARKGKKHAARKGKKG